MTSQVALGKLEEAARVRKAMAEDAKRAAHAITQLERELAGRQGRMAAQAEELNALQEAQRSAHVQINQYVIDLQVQHCLSVHNAARALYGSAMRLMPGKGNQIWQQRMR